MCVHLYFLLGRLHYFLSVSLCWRNPFVWGVQLAAIDPRLNDIQACQSRNASFLGILPWYGIYSFSIWIYLWFKLNIYDLQVMFQIKYSVSILWDHKHNLLIKGLEGGPEWKVGRGILFFNVSSFVLVVGI